MIPSDRARLVTRKTTLHEQDDSSDLRTTTTPQERWSMMWQLARNANAFRGEPVAEPGLHRHITRLFRRKLENEQDEPTDQI